MDITALYQIFLGCTGITTDSRNCPEGSLFIALKGDTFNGNAFAAQALEAGSTYAVVDEAAYAPAGDTRYILVDNCLHTLQQLANYHRRQLGTRIIGITGTNGKTTTKELISAVLSQKYNVLYTLGNLNNPIGVPLTLLRLTTEHELGVVEMGASHPGDIKELVEIAEPDYGIITNVGKAHLEGFGSFRRRYPDQRRTVRLSAPAGKLHHLPSSGQSLPQGNSPGTESDNLRRRKQSVYQRPRYRQFPLPRF